ncbi:arginine N-methyltransferase [Trifolium pratense]|uniref:Arginine N-methyltransferase n=1 Tax=Trifolium pratense TaxID=57577 RepID=A0A2K3NVH7_TRIPR|nr:arginine N-methyltransferase [Trifolium pratense]
MPLVDNEKDTSRSKLCGLETYFNKSMTHILGANVFIDGGFDFVVVPLMSPTYRPSLVQQFGSFSIEASLPCARSDLDPMPYLWQDHVIVKFSSSLFLKPLGEDKINFKLPIFLWFLEKLLAEAIRKISEWIDLDSPDEMVRKDSETAFKQELAWASYLSLQACILPTPKGNSWTNYARCANQFLQEQPKEMQLWLRIPLGKPDGDSVEIYRTPDDYWKIWNSFRLMCDHNSKLLVALDNWSTMPSENSLNSWYGEPVVTFIIHTNSFFTRDGDNPKHLSEGLQKLIAYFLNHFTQIIISEVQLFSESISEVQHNYRNVDAISDEASRRRHLLPHIHYLRSLYQQVGPLSSPLSLQEHLQLAVRDVIQYTSQVLVVVDAGHGALVKTSLQAAKETGRKLKVYAVEKNLNPLPYLYDVAYEEIMS